MDVNDAAHAIFVSAKYARLFPTSVRCLKCGRKFGAFYCESRLYAIVCRNCYTVTLVKGDDPNRAAEKVGERA